MRQDLGSWLKLQQAPGVGPALFRKLLEYFTDPAMVIKARTAELSRLGLTPHCIDYLHDDSDAAAIAVAIDWSQQPGQHILTLADDAYPPQLKAIHNPPPVLYVRGDHTLLSDPQLAIVGSRNPSRSGQDNARAFARHLSQTGLIVTSGLALGIDAAAHQGALAANAPTIAVMATGIDRIYPAKHKALAESILERGALVSELPLGTKPKPELFPQRNRIISGLSQGVLVVEAAQRSGSLITAHLAMEQAREVFAIPGSIHNPVARGCHQLIRQGAKLVESVQDILEELAPQLLHTLQTENPAGESKNPDSIPELDPDYRNLLENIDYEPVSIDQLVKRSGLPAQSVSSMVLILELQGLIRSETAGRYCRI